MLPRGCLPSQEAFEADAVQRWQGGDARRYKLHLPHTLAQTARVSLRFCWPVAATWFTDCLRKRENISWSNQVVKKSQDTVLFALTETKTFDLFMSAHEAPTQPICLFHTRPPQCTCAHTHHSHHSARQPWPFPWEWCVCGVAARASAAPCGSPAREGHHECDGGRKRAILTQLWDLQIVCWGFLLSQSARSRAATQHRHGCSFSEMSQMPSVRKAAANAPLGLSWRAHQQQQVI